MSKAIFLICDQCSIPGWYSEIFVQNICHPAVKEGRRAAGEGYHGSGQFSRFDSVLLTYRHLSLSKGIEQLTEGNVGLKVQAG